MTDSRMTLAGEYHITGPGPKKYLPDELVNFMENAGYFSLKDKFRTPSVAPVSLTTTEAKPIIQKYTPLSTESLTSALKVTYQFTVGVNQVLDLGSTFFDIQGTMDRGRSFKPYDGTKWNSLAPKNCPLNYVEIPTGQTVNASQVRVAQLNVENAGTVQIVDNGIVELKKVYNPFRSDNPNLGDSTTGDWVGTGMLGMSAALFQQNFNIWETTAYGAYAPPAQLTGCQQKADPQFSYWGISGKNDNQVNTTPPTNYVTAILMMYQGFVPAHPDTHCVGSIDTNQAFAVCDLPQYVGFRDNFIGLMYYDYAGMQGVLQPTPANGNLVDSASDRNTELSYQYELAKRGDRFKSFPLWNQMVDTYRHDIRFLNNKGSDDGLASWVFNNAANTTLAQFSAQTGATGTQSLYTTTQNASTIAASYGCSGIGQINMKATMFRNWLWRNIGRYFPDSLMVDPLSKNNNFTAAYPKARENFHPYEYGYKNASFPINNLAEVWSQMGARWSVDFMDNVNPFNHHQNYGLRQRSEILGNQRICNFHIQVPQKFFGIKNLILLPGDYTYSWYLRTDPNLVFQSSTGCDLRSDGAGVTYDIVNLYAYYFPMNNVSVANLITLLRGAASAQNFAQFLGCKQDIIDIPAGATNTVVNVPAIGYDCFRGWAFGRCYSKETPNLQTQYDPSFRYSGTIPLMDNTWYLNHTFNSIRFTFNNSLQWPGNQRFLEPSYMQIKIPLADDNQGYTMAQSTITKDWYFIQMISENNQGYQGYSLDSLTSSHIYSFTRNYTPMNIQTPKPGQEAYFDLLNLGPEGSIVNNSGFDNTTPGYLQPQGIPWPSNWPYESNASVNPGVRYQTTSKFLVDRYMWEMPFSASFLSLGLLSDLGQSFFFSGQAQTLSMTLTFDQLDEASKLVLQYLVFDTVKIDQQARNRINISYFRVPFSSGSSPR